MNKFFVELKGKKVEIVTIEHAAKALGVIPRRVRQLVSMDCPKCSGDGCKECFETGCRLPVVQFGSRKVVIKAGLLLDWNAARGVGKDSAYSTPAAE